MSKPNDAKSIEKSGSKNEGQGYKHIDQANVLLKDDNNDTEEIAHEQRLQELKQSLTKKSSIKDRAAADMHQQDSENV